MNRKDYLSLPIKFEVATDDSFDSERFMKVRLWMMHDQLNLNNSYFEMNDIEKAKNTISNIPILGFIKKLDGTDERDFGGHEIEYKITEDDVEVVYLERPLGLIPSENNYHYETIEDKEFVVVDGYLWKTYLNEGLDILDEDKTKGCSMEISIDKGEFRKGESFYRIIDYKYLGVTILGDNVQAGMKNAHLDVIENEVETETFSNQYFTMVNELSESLKNYTQNNKDSISNINIDNNKKEEVDNMAKTKKEIAEKFSLTYENLENEIRKVLRTCVYKCVDWWGDEYECRKYWLEDFDDVFIYAYDCEQDIYSKLSYSKQEDDVVIDFESASRVKPTFVDWVSGISTEDGETMDNDMEMESFAKELKEDIKLTYLTKFEEKSKVKDSEITTLKGDLETFKENDETIKTKFTELEKTVVEKDAEIQRLKKFELDTIHIETQENADALFTKYAEYISEDEKKELNSKLFEFVNYSDFEDEVRALVLPKIEAQLYALKQNSNLTDPNKIDISLMGLPIIDIKNKTNKSSIELLEDYVQN